MKNHKPDDEERRKWQNPERILADIGLKAGDTFIDIGCGKGYFALPAASSVGKYGRVWGIDIDQQALESLKLKAEQAGHKNIQLAAGKAEELVLCQGCADIIFLGVVLHDFENPAKVLENARDMLKPGGRLINLDWKKELMQFGPKLSKRISANNAAGLIETAGFDIEHINQSSPYHYIITARMQI